MHGKRENIRYLQTFMTCWKDNGLSNKIIGMILTALDQGQSKRNISQFCIWSILVRFEP